MRTIALFFCSFLISGLVFAAQDSAKNAIQLSISDGNLESQQILIQSKLLEVDYAEMSLDNRKLVAVELDAIVSGAITGDAALKAQNNINELLVQAFSDSKIVCIREKKTGSNMPTRTCMTAAAKKRQHDKTQEDMSKGRLPNSATPSN